MISYNDITLFIMHRQLYEHPQIPHLGGDEITKEKRQVQEHNAQNGRFRSRMVK